MTFISQWPKRRFNTESFFAGYTDEEIQQDFQNELT